MFLSPIAKVRGPDRNRERQRAFIAFCFLVACFGKFTIPHAKMPLFVTCGFSLSAGEGYILSTRFANLWGEEVKSLPPLFAPIIEATTRMHNFYTFCGFQDK